MPLAAEYPFLEILATICFFFLWVAWIWLLVGILTDVFGRSEFSGSKKALWTVFLVFLPFLGVFCYLLAHGDDIARRSPRASGATNGAATEIAEAKRLLDTGAISEAEYGQLKVKALA